MKNVEIMNRRKDRLFHILAQPWDPRHETWEEFENKLDQAYKEYCRMTRTYMLKSRVAAAFFILTI
ncbi:hypothetical protein [Paenibacillus sp. HGF7]|uniref:hypothetical protein n=1 Tax=Paenibacillus sp. HGF7 TaxID=944559 RepID=UPI001478B082|nr:hypothetical protein [Paenibacillus sp. HGF7]